MKKLYNQVRTTAKLCYNFIFTNKTRILTLRVIALSAWIRLRIRFIPMSRLEKSFGIAMRESSYEETRENLRYANLIGRRVERVCKKTIWDSKCLVQALTAQHLLAKRNIHTTLYLGLRKEDGTMRAHAWLRCGSLRITGGYGNEHTAVSTFYR